MPPVGNPYTPPNPPDPYTPPDGVWNVTGSINATGEITVAGGVNNGTASGEIWTANGNGRLRANGVLVSSGGMVLESAVADMTLKVNGSNRVTVSSANGLVSMLAGIIIGQESLGVLSPTDTNVSLSTTDGIGHVRSTITSGTNRTVTLPAASGSGRRIGVARRGAGGGTLTVNPAGGDTIDGGAGVVIAAGNAKFFVDTASGDWNVY